MRLRQQVPLSASCPYGEVERERYLHYDVGRMRVFMLFSHRESRAYLLSFLLSVGLAACLPSTEGTQLRSKGTQALDGTHSILDPLEEISGSGTGIILEACEKDKGALSWRCAGEQIKQASFYGNLRPAFIKLTEQTIDEVADQHKLRVADTTYAIASCINRDPKAEVSEEYLQDCAAERNAPTWHCRVPSAEQRRPFCNTLALQNEDLSHFSRWDFLAQESYLLCRDLSAPFFSAGFAERVKQVFEKGLVPESWEQAYLDRKRAELRGDLVDRSQYLLGTGQVSFQNIYLLEQVLLGTLRFQGKRPGIENEEAMVRKLDEQWFASELVGDGGHGSLVALLLQREWSLSWRRAVLQSPVIRPSNLSILSDYAFVRYYNGRLFHPDWLPNHTDPKAFVVTNTTVLGGKGTVMLNNDSAKVGQFKEDAEQPAPQDASMHFGEAIASPYLSKHHRVPIPVGSGRIILSGEL